MKFVLAPDSFKESLSAKEVCLAMETGIRRVFPEAEIIHVPIADGGEGTIESMVDATGGEYVVEEVRDPLGNIIKAKYGVLGTEDTAVIEMASASGIQLVEKEKRDPLKTNTYGTGELIKACLDRGMKKIILGIGGSATNDGGVGMAQALGYRFLDVDGQEIDGSGGSLAHLASIHTDHVHPKLMACEIHVASDVKNPLYGLEGTSAVFGPQKGATPEVVSQLDKNLRHLDKIIQSDLNKSVGAIPGSGAAGGLGAGLLAFTNAEMNIGSDLIVEATRLKEKLKGADYCFTGEGQIDFQTKYGKAPYGVMKAAKSVDENIKVIAIVGSVGENIEELYEVGFDGIFGIIPTFTDYVNLFSKTRENIIRTTEAICRVIK